MPLEQLPLPVLHWRDLLEILIVAYVIYRLLRFLVGTRALQILLGPLTQGPVSDRSLGTRHRAAVGLSEESPTISMARRGTLRRGLTMDSVRLLLADGAE